MSTPVELGPIDHIVELARKIMDECPSCAGRASEITTWAAEIRERRPSRGELEALIDATCGSLYQFSLTRTCVPSRADRWT